jgi:hypothetical protein
VHSGEITLRVVVEPRRPAPVTVTLGAPLIWTPTPTFGPDTPEQDSPAPEPPTGPGETRVCRREGCEHAGTAQPITEFARNGKNSESRKWACRTCEIKRKRDERARAARLRLGA